MGRKSWNCYETLLQIDKILRHSAGADVQNSNWTLQKGRYLDYRYDKCPNYPFCVRGVRWLSQCSKDNDDDNSRYQANSKRDPRNCKCVNNSASHLAHSSEMIIGYGFANVAIAPCNGDGDEKHNNWFSAKLVTNRYSCTIKYIHLQSSSFETTEIWILMEIQSYY